MWMYLFNLSGLNWRMKWIGAKHEIHYLSNWSSVFTGVTGPHWDYVMVSTIFIMIDWAFPIQFAAHSHQDSELQMRHKMPSTSRQWYLCFLNLLIPSTFTDLKSRMCGLTETLYNPHRNLNCFSNLVGFFFSLFACGSTEIFCCLAFPGIFNHFFKYSRISFYSGF